MTKPVINRKWRTDYKPQVGDIVKFHMFGCRDRVGVVLGIEKREEDYTTCKVIEEGCLVSYNNKGIIPIPEMEEILEKYGKLYKIPVEHKVYNKFISHFASVS